MEPEKFTFSYGNGRTYTTFRRGAKVFIVVQYESIVICDVVISTFEDGAACTDLEIRAQQIIDNEDPLLVF